MVYCRRCGYPVPTSVDVKEELIKYNRTTLYHCPDCGYDGNYGYYKPIIARCPNCKSLCDNVTFLMSMEGCNLYCFNCPCTEGKITVDGSCIVEDNKDCQ